tara:strand:+ start:304 stop:474 length:171 start_codon:yes stop_codon:yes gene_type:complete
MCGKFVLDDLNIYTVEKISTLHRFENYKKYGQNQQNCRYFIKYPKEFRRFCVFFRL